MNPEIERTNILLPWSLHRL